jgi:hypothetical protein
VTEYELITAREAILQTVNGLADVQASHQAVYLSLVFGYITVAYVAGLKLTRTQLFLGTIAFVIAGARQVVSIGILAYTIAYKAEQLSSLTGQSLIVKPETIILPSIMIWSSGILIGLLFMWSVRHPKTE